MRPASIVISHNADTLRNANFVANLGPPDWDRYTHEIRDIGGFWAASFNLLRPQDELLEMFENGLDREVVVTAESGTEVWEGYIDELALTIRGVELRKSLNRMANKVWVRYSSAGVSGVRSTAYSDAVSQAAYGVKERPFSGGQAISAGQANQAAQVILSRIKSPDIPSMRWTGGEQEEMTLSIRCKGWWHKLYWRVYNQTVLKGMISAYALIHRILDSLETTTVVNYCKNPSFEVNASDDWVSYTIALLHMDGIDGATTFPDEAGKVWTPNGNAQVDTAQSQFGGASGLFDGAGDYLSTPNHADFDFGTGDWTVDFWIRRNGTKAYPSVIGTITGVGGAGWAIGLGNSDNKVRVAWFDVPKILTAGTIADLTWTHVAVVRNGNTVKCYINGTADANTDDCTGDSINSQGTGAVIGRIATAIDNYYWIGWIDELRVSKGVARWTANFSVPTGPDALRDTAQSYLGVASTRIAALPAATHLYGVAGVSVPSGSVVAGHCWARCGADPTGNKASLVLYDQTTPAVRATAYATAAASGAWERLSVVWLNDTGVAKTVGLRLFNSFNDSATPVWFDACQLELGAVSPYCDGTRPNCGWSGTAHNSTSWRKTLGPVKGRAILPNDTAVQEEYDADMWPADIMKGVAALGDQDFNKWVIGMREGKTLYYEPAAPSVPAGEPA